MPERRAVLKRIGGVGRRRSTPSCTLGGKRRRSVRQPRLPEEQLSQACYRHPGPASAANSKDEALYPIYARDNEGQKTHDGSSARYILRYAMANSPPPVNSVLVADDCDALPSQAAGEESDQTAT